MKFPGFYKISNPGKMLPGPELWGINIFISTNMGY
jgi:hypothetical protein